MKLIKGKNETPKDVLFDLQVTYISGARETFEGMIFEDCKTVCDVRNWINDCCPFIDLRSVLVNLTTVQRINVLESLEQD